MFTPIPCQKPISRSLLSVIKLPKIADAAKNKIIPDNEFTTSKTRELSKIAEKIEINMLIANTARYFLKQTMNDSIYVISALNIFVEINFMNIPSM